MAKGKKKNFRKKKVSTDRGTGQYRVVRRVSREETGIYFATEEVVYYDVVTHKGKTLMRFSDYAPFEMLVELDPDGAHVWVTDGGERTKYAIEPTFDPEGHYAHGARAEDWNPD